MSEPDFTEPDRLEGAPHPRHTHQLIGQEPAEAEFLQAFNLGRLHHAWLISGPGGVGKATLAWKIARFLLAQPAEDQGGVLAETAPQTLDVPADHPVTRRLAALSDSGLYLCRRPWDHDKSRLKQNITVDEIRKLKGFFGLSAADGGRRVVIIDAADDMNSNAANALLKILEEPPANTTILLVAHRPSHLLATIRSRCRALKCQKLPQNLLMQAVGNAGVQIDAAPDKLGQLADGSVGGAIGLLSGEGLAIYDNLLALLKSAPRMDRNLAHALANGCVGKNNEPRYTLTLRLVLIMLARLGKFGATPKADRVNFAEEAAVFEDKSRNVRDARKWAELVQTIQSRTLHARAVNLDPASVILDILLKLDQASARPANVI